MRRLARILDVPLPTANGLVARLIDFVGPPSERVDLLDASAREPSAFNHRLRELEQDRRVRAFGPPVCAQHPASEVLVVVRRDDDGLAARRRALAHERGRARELGADVRAARARLRDLSDRVVMVRARREVEHVVPDQRARLELLDQAAGAVDRARSELVDDVDVRVASDQRERPRSPRLPVRRVVPAQIEEAAGVVGSDSP